MSTTASSDTHRASVPAPSAHDFLGIDALLNDDERLIRDTVREFVRDRVLPNIAQWFEDHMPFDAFVSPDGLHMNDWSYACLAKWLGTAIVEAATRPIATAGRP